MKNLKAYQKSVLVLEFGLLMAPLVELARGQQPPSAAECRIAIAKVQACDNAWRGKVREFTTFAPDIWLHQEYQDISHVPERCLGGLKGMIGEPNELQERIRQVIENAQRTFFEYVDCIPIEWEPVVFEANTPFTSYLRIKETIVTLNQRLHYFDRYLKPDFFELFLASVERAVSIRLVTTANGVRNVAAVSNLAQQEFVDFQLVEVDPSDLHDRNLRADGLIFSLGPGIDRAGMALTNFGPSDSSAEAHRGFDLIIANGRVVS